VPAVFQQHTRVSRGGLAREQENLEVRGGVGIANQSGSIISSQGSTTSSSSYPSLIAQPTTVTTGHHGEYSSGHSSPTTTPPGKLLRPSRTGTSSSSSTSHRRSCSPREFTFRPFSSTIKATPRFALIH
jgi:hypothetical protein